MNKCSVEGCMRESNNSLYCTGHYYRLWKLGHVGSAIFERPLAIKKKCSIEGCNRISMSIINYCSLHYKRYKRNGDAGEAGRRKWRIKEKCMTDGYETVSKIRGLCEKHYRHWHRSRCDVSGCINEKSKAGLCLEHRI